jgi:hypothetical protein
MWEHAIFSKPTGIGRSSTSSSPHLTSQQQTGTPINEKALGGTSRRDKCTNRNIRLEQAIERESIIVIIILSCVSSRPQLHRHTHKYVSVHNACTASA